MNNEKSFQDTVYGNFNYPHYFEPIIYSKPVLRLCRIKQLGMLEQVYPGGDGNRFSHSLGVMHLFAVFFDKLVKPDNENYDINFARYYKKDSLEDWVRCWREIAMLCGLLHDIGHGPLSHSFEQIVIGANDKKNKSELISHEDWTLYIVEFWLLSDEFKKYICKWEANNLNNEYSKQHTKFKKGTSVEEFVENENKKRKMSLNEKLDEVLGILKYVYNKKNNSDKYLTNSNNQFGFMMISKLLSGSFDLDKLDYLMRDRKHLGFGFNNIDYDWLLEAIGFNYNHMEPDKAHVYFKENACTALDEFIFLRITYYWKCIFHQRVRLYDCLAKNFFVLLCKSYEDKIKKSEKCLGAPNCLQNFVETVYLSDDEFEKDKSKYINKYLSLDDCTAWNILKLISDETFDCCHIVAKNANVGLVLKLIADQFVNKKDIYDCFYEIHSGPDKVDSEKLNEINTYYVKRLRREVGVDLVEKNNMVELLKLLFFWDEPNLESHIKKEKKDILIKKKTKPDKGRLYFPLLERSQISQLFIKGTLVRRYYIYNPFGMGIAKHIKEEILKIKNR